MEDIKCIQRFGGETLGIRKQKALTFKRDKLKVTVLNDAPLREMAVQFHALTSAFDEGYLVTCMPRSLYHLGEEPPVSI